MKKINKLPKEIREESRLSTLKVFEFVYNRVFPVYRFNSDEIPELVGSGFLINYRKNLFFVTAGHVHDRNSPEHPLFYYVESDKVVYLAGPYITTRSQTPDRIDDNLDFTVYYVDPVRNRPSPESLHQDIPANWIATDSTFITDCKYFVSGFPLTRFKPDKNNMLLNPEVYMWCGGPGSEEAYIRENVSQKSHIMVRFKENNNVNAFTGASGYTNLKPRGISGGCVWAAYGYRDNLGRLVFNELALVGLVTLHSPSEKALLCTRIDKVIDFTDQLIEIANIPCSY